MDKCNWKDGKRIYCNPAENNLPSIDDNFCRFCGGYIREIISESDKPLIVKSGETWVMELDGKNYLCVFLSRYETTDPLDMEEQKSEIIIKGIGVGCWKSFSEIEKEGLTDEIAHLHPVLNDEGDYITLLSLWKGIIYTDVGEYVEESNNLRLATSLEIDTND